MESVLPFVAVSNDGELEIGAVQQDELHIGDCVHLLDLWTHVCICEGRGEGGGGVDGHGKKGKMGLKQNY